MQKMRKLILAMTVIALVFTANKAIATSRGCVLNDAKLVESENSCTPKTSTGTYKVTVNHSPNSASSKLSVGLNEWNVTKAKYVYRACYTIDKNKTNTWYPACSSDCKWAKLRLTAEGSTATGTGIISNEF